MRIRCPSFLRHKYASTARQYSAALIADWQSSMVTVPDEPESVEGEIRIDVLDRFALAGDHVGEAARRDDDPRVAPRELGAHPAHQAVDHLHLAEAEARLHRPDRVLA